MGIPLADLPALDFDPYGDEHLADPLLRLAQQRDAGADLRSHHDALGRAGRHHLNNTVRAYDRIRLRVTPR